MPDSLIPIQSKPGIQRDGTRFDGEAYSDGLWVRWDRGKPRKMRGYRAITNRVSEVSRGATSFTRSGSVYVHTGGANLLEQIAFNVLGYGSAVADRTPAALIASPTNVWQFDTIFDPIVNNNAMVVAHAAQALVDIDSVTETPVFWGPIDAVTALTPLGMPVQQTPLAITTVTGSTTNASTAVTAVSSTASLVYGMTVAGTGIPANTYIAAIGAGAITLSQAATATNAGVTLTITTGGVSGGVVALHPYLLTFGSSGLIQWSTPLAKGNTPADFWSNGSGQAYVTDQRIVVAKVLRGGPGFSPAGLFWSLNALVRATFIGGAAVFSFDTISDTISIMSSRSVVEMDGVYFWAGSDRFYMFGGTLREIPNTMNANWFFDNLNYAQRQKVFAFRNTRWGEIWWCFPFGSASECTHAIIYNTRGNTWYDTAIPLHRVAAESANVFPYPIMFGDRIDAISSKYVLWQHEYGTDEYPINMATLAIRSYVETSNFTAITGEKPADKLLSISVMEPDMVQAGDMTVTVTGEANAKAATVDSPPQTIYATPASSQQQVATFRETRRILRLRFESNVVGGDFQFGANIAHVQLGDGTHLG